MNAAVRFTLVDASITILRPPLLAVRLLRALWDRRSTSTSISNGKGRNTDNRWIELESSAIHEEIDRIFHGPTRINLGGSYKRADGGGHCEVSL